MTDHTKLPWAAKPFKQYGDGFVIGNDSSNAAFVPGYQDHPQIAANAAFIVKACNAHQAYDELDRASAYYISRLEIMARGAPVRDLGEAESWYRFALGKLIESAETTAEHTSDDGGGAAK